MFVGLQVVASGCLVLRFGGFGLCVCVIGVMDGPAVCVMFRCVESVSVRYLVGLSREDWWALCCILFVSGSLSV